MQGCKTCRRPNKLKRLISVEGNISYRLPSCCRQCPWIDPDCKKLVDLESQAQKQCQAFAKHHPEVTPAPSIDWYMKVFAAQGGVCLDCGKPAGTCLSIDHSHRTNALRGLLCPRCNLKLGTYEACPEEFKAPPAWLSWAAPYSVSGYVVGHCGQFSPL